MMAATRPTLFDRITRGVMVLAGFVLIVIGLPFLALPFAVVSLGNLLIGWGKGAADADGEGE
jgi:cytochrome b subunit of formate dehydrogenase